MNEAVDSGVFPSAQLLVVKNGRTLLHEAYGNATLEAIFDIASLTKPISTTTLLMQMVTDDKIRLDEGVQAFLPQCQCDTKRPITIKELLSHSSGLPAWEPYYQTVPADNIGTPSGKLQIIDECCREPLEYVPGTGSIYSDIGFILLGEMIEKLCKKTLDKLFLEKIAKPLGLANTFFVPLKPITDNRSQITEFAPTEDCPWRHKVMKGEVHDQNCYAMGGVAGHAGLFSTTTDIGKFIPALVKSYKETCAFSEKCVSQEVVQRFLPFHQTLFDSTWLLGWDTPSQHTNSQAGSHFSKRSIGHLGYTGCSMWIDLEKDFWVVLLSNRIHPTTTNEKIKSFRPYLHNLIFESLIV